jgi:hypothetical protein
MPISPDRLSSDRFVKQRVGSSPIKYLIGVPINEILEHLDATIADATPLYELCTNVLRSAPP